MKKACQQGQQRLGAIKLKESANAAKRYGSRGPWAGH
jgi:hypothetical protein